MVNSIYEKLYEQSNIEDMICLADVVTEEQRLAWNQEKYEISYTKSSWEQTYPTIPAKFIYYPKKCLFSSDALYIDLDHYTIFHTGLYGTNFLFPGENDFEMIMNKIISEKLKQYKEKKYYALISPILSEGTGNTALYVLNKILEQEIPCPELYDLFLNVYTSTDTGVQKLSQLALSNLWKCQSEEQRAEVLDELSKYPEELTIYRGEGNASTKYKNALSWTIDYKVAEFFACRRGAEKARIVTATIKKSNVFTYLDDDEQEIIINPKYIENPTFYEYLPLDEFLHEVVSIPSGLSKIKNIQNTSGKNILSIVNRLYHNHKSNYHNAAHTCRVTLLVSYIYRMDILNKKAVKEENIQEYFDLLTATEYHDIGRTNEDVDDSHGIKSYDIYKKDHKENEIVKFLIEYHCIDDTKALERLQDFPQNEREAIWNLYQVLKDADALDRVRFEGPDKLDSNYLRLQTSKNLIAVAYALQNYKMEP